MYAFVNGGTTIIILGRRKYLRIERLPGIGMWRGINLFPGQETILQHMRRAGPARGWKEINYLDLCGIKKP